MVRKKEAGWNEGMHGTFGHVLAIIAIILVVVVFGGAYYLVIAPNLVAKPFIEKPSLPADALERIRAGEHIINSSYINYITNEIGAYKLRAPFGTKNYPIVEFFLKDIGKTYYTYVKDHIPFTKEGNPKNEDIVIRGSQEAVLVILESPNTLGAVKKAIKDKDGEVELKADMKTLATKGYFSIYDTLK